MTHINKYILLGMILISSFITASCTSEQGSDSNTSSSLVSQSMSMHSRIHGEEFEVHITDKILNESPAWSIGKPVPLSIEEAVGIARKEVQKYDKKEGAWEVTSIHLQRLGEEQWFYVIQFDPTKGMSSAPPSNDYIVVPVLLNGKTVERKK